MAYPNGYSTLSLDFKAVRDDEEIFVGPVFFTTQESQNQQPAQRLTAGYSNKQFEMKWGNISASLTELSGGGGILGTEMVYYTEDKKLKKGWRYQIDAGRTRKAVEASDATSGVGTYSQRLYGGKVNYYLADGWDVYVAGMDVRDNPESIKNPGPTKPLENQATAVGVDATFKSFWVDSFKGEVGYSDATLSDPQANDAKNYKDAAWKFSASRNVKEIATSFSANYAEYRPNFLFLYGGAGSDNRSLGMTSNTTLFSSKLSFGTGYNWNRDNLNNSKENTNFTNAVNLTPTLTIKNWPTLTLSDSLSFQDSYVRDQLNSNSINNAASLGANYPFKFWEKNQTLGATVSQNDSLTQSQTQAQTSRARSFSGNYSMANVFTWLALAANYSHSISETSSAPLISYSQNAGLNLTPTIVDWKLSVPLGFTFARNYNDAEPKTTHSVTFGSTLSIAYALMQKHNLSLSLGYSVFNDLLNSAANYNQFTLTFGYNTQL